MIVNNDILKPKMVNNIPNPIWFIAQSSRGDGTSTKILMHVLDASIDGGVILIVEQSQHFYFRQRINELLSQGYVGIESNITIYAASDNIDISRSQWNTFFSGIVFCDHAALDLI